MEACSVHAIQERNLGMSIRILQGDVTDRLKDLPDGHFHCVVTSPPYWGLRDYGTAEWEGGDPACDHQIPASTERGGGNKGHGGSFTANYKVLCGKCGAVRRDRQLGLEKTPEEYVANMVRVFREVRRVLRDDGTLWLNLGDSYARAGGEGGHGPNAQVGNTRSLEQRRNLVPPNGLKSKDLVGIPWRVAFALQADGWYLRQDIVWSKGNPMPESVRDRCTKSHEYVFLLTKSPRYYFDGLAVAEPLARPDEGARKTPAELGGRDKFEEAKKHSRLHSGNDYLGTPTGTRNRRSVWKVNSRPYKGAHFATFPPELPRLCISAGTSEKGCCPDCGKPWKRVATRVRKPTRPGNDTKVEGLEGMEIGNRDPLRHVTATETVGWEAGCGCAKDPVPCRVLDPFGGSGTTAVVAESLGRDSCLIELNPDYVPLIHERLAKSGFQVAPEPLPLFDNLDAA
jgi:DNA modification methylase